MQCDCTAFMFGGTHTIRMNSSHFEKWFYRIMSFFLFLISSLSQGTFKAALIWPY